MKNLARCVGIAAVLAGVAVAGTEAKAATVNIFAWTNAAPCLSYLQPAAAALALPANWGCWFHRRYRYCFSTGLFSTPLKRLHWI